MQDVIRMSAAYGSYMADYLRLIGLQKGGGGH